VWVSAAHLDCHLSVNGFPVFATECLFMLKFSGKYQRVYFEVEFTIQCKNPAFEEPPYDRKPFENKLVFSRSDMIRNFSLAMERC
jgi:hypothetical protein